MSRARLSVFPNDKVLNELGWIRTPDGAILDNRDGFYTDHPESFVGEYDTRTCVPIRKDLLMKLIQEAQRDR